MIIALALSMLILATGCKPTVTINLEDYFTVEFSGYNGYGKAKVSYPDLEGALVKALKDNNIIDTESLFGL